MRADRQSADPTNRRTAGIDVVDRAIPRLFVVEIGNDPAQNDTLPRQPALLGTGGTGCGIGYIPVHDGRGTRLPVDAEIVSQNQNCLPNLSRYFSPIIGQLD